MDDLRKKLAPRSWKVDLGRVVAGGLGSVLALATAGWPSNAAEAAWAGLAGLIGGLGVALVIEYLLRLRVAVGRLRSMESELETEKEMRAEERRLSERLLLVERRRAAVAEVGIEIWGGAFNEAAKTGHILPVSAILARHEVTLKARNLDKPLPPET